MKHFKTPLIILCSSVLFFYGCNDNNKAQKQDIIDAVEVSNTPNPLETKTPIPTAAEPAQNASGVWHYTCRIGCAGGAGSAINCETCENTLVHNTGYHANTNTSTSSAPFATPPTVTAPREPSQNTAGVWHYTCAKGHAGGAGSAIACSTCSETLSHNTAYH